MSRHCIICSFREIPLHCSICEKEVDNKEKIEFKNDNIFCWRCKMKFKNDDMLSNIFKKQSDLQNKLGNHNLVGNIDYIKITTIALIDEVMEALRETPWKPWKKQQKFNQENFKEEIIDIWHFLINLSLASGMDSTEVYNRFIKKNIINHKRKEVGY